MAHKTKARPQKRIRRAPPVTLPEKPAKHPHHTARIDIAGSGEFWTKNKASNDLTLSGFSTDLFFGNTWTFMLHAHTGNGETGDLKAGATGLALGVGYAISLADNHVEIHPHFGVGFESREVRGEAKNQLALSNNIQRDEMAPLFDLGLTFRLMPTSPFGIHLGFDIFVIGVDENYTGEYFTGVAQQVSGGVTLRF